jgi:creatinine amidohydrolase
MVDTSRLMLMCFSPNPFVLRLAGVPLIVSLSYHPSHMVSISTILIFLERSTSNQMYSFRFCINITKSVAYHGFKKILIVNGHGSNTPLIDLIARQTVLETDALCAAVNYIPLALEAFDSVKDTSVVAHADEFETSLYLRLAADRVQMDKAGADDDVAGRHFSSDSTSNYFVRFNDYWSRWTQLGVHGDATTATAEKGAVIYEAAVSQLVEIVDELRDWPITDRTDLHRTPTPRDMRW